MNKLKKALIKFTNSNPSLFPNNDDSGMLIRQQFSQFFDVDTNFHTPNHPPYAAYLYRFWFKKKKEKKSDGLAREFGAEPITWGMVWSRAIGRRHRAIRLGVLVSGDPHETTNPNAGTTSLPT
nr:myb/SANT-like domain-containing protein [Tanacetum cinerariifolium]